MTYTFEEVKEKLSNSDKLPEGIKLTCACGKHVTPHKLTDKDIMEIVNILNKQEENP